MPSPILVLGATGNVGRPLVERLAGLGLPVRAATRRPDAYTPSQTSVEAVAFDYDDEATYGPALAGISRVFVLPRSGDLDPERPLLAFLDAAVRAGVRQAVLLTAMGIETAEDLPLRRVEHAFLDAPLSITLLRPNWLMQNFSTGFLQGMIDKTGVFFLPAADARTSFVDARDVAAVAAAVLTSDEHAGRAYALTGPEALTYREAAEVLSEASGRRITYMPVPEVAMKAALRGMGWDAEGVRLMAELFAAVRAGASAPVSPDVASILGRPARSLASFARDYADRLRPSTAS